MENKVLFFIRHGECSTNLITNGEFSIDFESPLTELGVKQSIATGKYLTNFWDSESILVSSNLLRASETANIISQTLNKNIDVKIYQNLREKLGGESVDDLLIRINSCINAIFDEHKDKKQFFIVTHGYVIISIIASLLSCKVDNIKMAHNCGISLVLNMDTLLTFNSVFHLYGQQGPNCSQ